MRLRELDACFVADWTEDDNFQEQENIERAQGVLFDCPACHNHSVLCWFKNPRNASPVPAWANPAPGRWEVSGDSLDNLTLKPSVNLDVLPPEIKEVCRWHGWVTNGDAK